MNEETVKADFHQVTDKHTMEIVLDDGVHRHLVFSTNGGSEGKYRLITWPGSLCITGDYGTYVFERTYDMFKFFGGGEKINPGYWSEKLTSQSIFGNGYEEFSKAAFEEAVTEGFESLFEDDGGGDDEEKAAVWAEIKQDVLSAQNETDAIRDAMDFEHDGKCVFSDFWETRVLVCHSTGNSHIQRTP